MAVGFCLVANDEAVQRSDVVTSHTHVCMIRLLISGFKEIKFNVFSRQLNHRMVALSQEQLFSLPEQ